MNMETKNTRKEKVSVIGLGLMGAAIARTLIEKGYQVTVWNRDAAKVMPLVNAGATAAPDAASAIAESPVTVVCVSHYDATRKILQENTTAATLKNRVLVQLSTGTPKEARDLETWVQQQGGICLNGDILAWPSQIGNESTTILVSGATDTFKQHETLLRALAGNLTYLGEPAGSSAALFAAVLSYLAGSWIGFCHGALILEKEGLKVNEYGAIMQAIAPILGNESKHMGEVIQHNQFTNPESTVKTTGDDLELLVQHSKEAGINDELPRFAADIFRRTMEAGFGQEEHAAIIKVLR